MAALLQTDALAASFFSDAGVGVRLGGSGPLEPRPPRLASPSLAMSCSECYVCWRPRAGAMGGGPHRGLWLVGWHALAAGQAGWPDAHSLSSLDAVSAFPRGRDGRRLGEQLLGVRRLGASGGPGEDWL
jgi:hypothetical protein